jgi:hypothetical protein
MVPGRNPQGKPDVFTQTHVELVDSVEGGRVKYQEAGFNEI